ncbi:helix-turn-helix transcriptional regulator [Streptomyces sp. IBSBF 3136]|uniref:helix-turn-helix transcriptional regulator n=1 Tax=Streptomyces sp. IBSBF 3136 TaxID=2903524 RepID=UPI002FDBF75D
MFDVLGIKDETAHIYRAVLNNPDGDFHEILRTTGLSEQELRNQLDILSELSLVRISGEAPARVRAVGPQTALKWLLARQEARLAEERKRTEDVRLAVEKLAAEFTEPPGGPVGEIEQAVGLDEIRDRIGLLCREVTTEVMAFAPGAQTAENMEAARPQDLELLDRGVRMRTMYLDSVRNHQPSVAYATWLTGRGGQVRTVPTLPVRMLIVDRHTAVVPMDDQSTGDGVLLLRGKGVLAAMCELFESFWQRATPLGDSRDPEAPHGPSRVETEYLRLLYDGYTDEVIARRLGVSPRTARRMAAELMEKLQARSRFQAGAKAVQRGWISAGP